MNVLRYLENLWQRWRGKPTATAVQAKPSATTASVMEQLRARISTRLTRQPVDRGYVYVSIPAIAPRVELDAFAAELRRDLASRLVMVVITVSGGITVVQIKWPASDSFTGVHHTTAG